MRRTVKSGDIHGERFVTVIPTAKRIRAFGAVAMVTAAAVGCSWRPASEALRPAPGMRVQLATRLAPAGSRLVYRRSDPTQNEQAFTSQSYEVVVGKSYRKEGDLISARIARIEPLLQKKNQPLPNAFDWPQTTQETWAFYLTFEPPLDACPPALVGDQPVTCKSRVTFYNWRGKELGAGAASRRIMLEGYEDVIAGDKPYADCIRLAVETTYDGSWSGKVKTIDYLWLAPRTGAVKRIQQISGRVLARPISSVTQWDLVDFHPGHGKFAGASLVGPWKRIAVRLAPAGTHPRLSGQFLEIDDLGLPSDSNLRETFHD